MPCGCGVKAGMVHVWVAGKTVILYYTQAIYEHFRDQVVHYKALYKFTFFFNLSSGQAITVYLHRKYVVFLRVILQ